MKRFFLFFLMVLMLALTACGDKNRISYADDLNVYDDTEVLDSDDESKTSLRGEIYVYVSGCVVNPGVYILPEGSRIYDAVNAAGGITGEGAEAAMTLVNIMHDGDRIVVPISKELTESAETTDDSMVNINQATAAQLTTLPGIGETRAKAIIAYRDKHGSFSKPEDIMKVSGIKEGTFEKIKDFIVVN